MLAHLGCLDSRAHRTSPISSSPSVSLWRAAAKGKTEFTEADAGRRKVRIKNAASCGLPHTSATSVAALAAAGRAAASRPACTPTREGRGLPRRLQQRRWNGWRRLAAHRPPLPASTTSAAGCDGGLAPCPRSATTPETERDSTESNGADYRTSPVPCKL